jgi:hypothetical protein
METQGVYPSKPDNRILILLAGDILTLALVTLFGFASHGTVGTAGSRMLATFLPLAMAWLLVAPFTGLFDPQRTAHPRQLWRPFWAMVLAGPLASWMRGMILNQPILPVFVVVLGGVSALAMLAWRFLFWLMFDRKKY